MLHVGILPVLKLAWCFSSVSSLSDSVCVVRHKIGMLSKNFSMWLKSLMEQKLRGCEDLFQVYGLLWWLIGPWPVMWQVVGSCQRCQRKVIGACLVPMAWDCRVSIFLVFISFKFHQILFGLFGHEWIFSWWVQMSVNLSLLLLMMVPAELRGAMLCFFCLHLRFWLYVIILCVTFFCI